MTKPTGSMGVVQFFRDNPVVGMITTIATLISIPLSLVLYFQGRATRDVVYAVYPLRTYLARAERPSNLRVEFKGQTITESDVIAVQIGIWNQGKMSIRPENVLEPLELVLIPPAPVLQSSVIRPSRDVAGLHLADDADVLKRGRVLIRFKILERGDGGTVQLIYAGSRSTRIELSGIVEGQGGARNLSPELLERDESPVERYRAYLREKTLNLGGAGLMVAGFVGLSIYIARDIRKNRALEIPVPKPFIVLMASILVGLFTIFVYALLDWWSSPIPSFLF